MTETSVLLSRLAGWLTVQSGKCLGLADHQPLPPPEERKLLLSGALELGAAAEEVLNLSLATWLDECKPHLEALERVNQELQDVLNNLANAQMVLEFATLFLSLALALKSGNPSQVGLSTYSILKKMGVPV